ncbi:teneurin-m-like isoform x8 [Plakobranchus ocellatus]|uniref:Teneurin-m-like isoform x8 n=1 Tax=Plakobranchus ocellatus TaxID=259542 RepID=A0AAV4D4K9_9GAST|nr:teneurin-m-like isoform x8 [Plakobranchus ocellatus]
MSPFSQHSHHTEVACFLLWLMLSPSLQAALMGVVNVVCPANCHQHGDCRLLHDKSVVACHCHRGWGGDSCQLKCTKPCANGTCLFAGSKQLCLCSPGYIGDLCDQPGYDMKGLLHLAKMMAGPDLQLPPLQSTTTTYKLLAATIIAPLQRHNIPIAAPQRTPAPDCHYNCTTTSTITTITTLSTNSSQSPPLPTATTPPQHHNQHLTSATTNHPIIAPQLTFYICHHHISPIIVPQLTPYICHHHISPIIAPQLTPYICHHHISPIIAPQLTSLCHHHISPIIRVQSYSVVPS